MDSQKQVAIVTGASAGIGRTVAKRLAADGYCVVLAARSTDKLEQLSDELAASGSASLPVACDVSDPNDLIQLVSTTLEHFGRIDVLVNNAGVECFGRFESLETDQVLQTVEVNITGSILLTRQVIPTMLQQGRGVVVNMASVAGKHCPAFGAVYGASKSALIGFTEGLRGEFGDRGITATAICPGFTTDGGIYDRMVEASGKSASAAVGGTTTDAVADAVCRGIASGPPEIMVNWPPIRPVMIFKALFPRLGEKMILAASRRFTKRVAEAVSKD